MRFEKALELLRDGKKMRRKGWSNNCYILQNKLKDKIIDHENRIVTFGESILADDWEIFERATLGEVAYNARYSLSSEHWESVRDKDVWQNVAKTVVAEYEARRKHEKNQR
ncbi:MAG: hypothetical protein OXD01_05020 [Gammaproteobacteria bacterium]|nr:hypothetical protein [Gammaproteobacteria bacterium]